MKKITLGLAIMTVFSGAAYAASMPMIKSDASTLISDPQFTEFRANQGQSDVWVRGGNKEEGLGDVGSSKDTAFDNEGSVRIRFRNASDDFTAVPGVSQTVSNLTPNTDYVLSFYYNDKKGEDSPSLLLAGAVGENGKTLVEKEIHVRDLSSSPQGDVKSSFRQAMVTFNSGANTSATIYANMRITDTAMIDMDGNIGKQTEVRLDEFALTTK